MSLTDLPTSSDAGTMTTNQPRPRNDRPRRRTFSTAYEQATAPGERGALLRREGLYHSRTGKT